MRAGSASATRRRYGKIFAMLVRGQLVVKLPQEGVDGLVDAEEGGNFDAHKGTPMKEWFALSPEFALDWSPLAREALAFVDGQQKRPAGG
ncbi:hypothetical protein [Streptomyces sp. NPDC001537]